MRVHRSRAVLATATIGLVVAALAAAPSAQAGAAASATAVDHVSTGSKTAAQHVIVLLKNQHSSLPANLGAGTRTARARAISSDQSGLVSKVRSLGATHVKQFNVINAVAATIKSDQLAALSHDPRVSAIVPDLPIKKPATATTDAAQPHAAAPSLPNGVPYSKVCSTDPAKPRLEPEALETMHVTSTAQKLSNSGAGVKVAWIADGIDINNPDFIRSNGQHVFVDYKDFSGDGLDAVTSGGEAFGDASSIGAQGLHTYNVNDFASTAHPLPAGCYIRVLGVAPGASMVGLKVFGNSDSAPTSHFISAIQYAVNTAGVNVLNESFGGDPYPDTMNDPVSLANNAAIAAGVTIVSSTGDAGTEGTIGSPATSSQVIAAAGTTNFRSAAQASLDGFSNPQAGIKGWANDNISSLSSGGYATSGKVPDVAAPGDSAWALCTPDPAKYEACTNLDGTAGASIEDFGGTSQSSPLTAGTAALVIAAYRKAHHGSSPSPATVKSIIVGTAQDLGHPAFEQGAGEVDALHAVQAALSMPGRGSTTRPSTARGTQLVTRTSRKGVDQLDLAGRAGHTVSGKYTITNASKSRRTISLSTRALTKVLKTQSGRLKLNPSQTFPNVTGDARAYKIIDVKVPIGADRLDASIAWPDPNRITFLALIDPFGTFQAYSSPQGAADFAHVDARWPAPGNWKAMVWASPAMTSPITYQFKSSQYQKFGSVHPAKVTLGAGKHATVTATFRLNHNAGDMSAAVVMKSPLAQRSSMPVSLRTLVPTGAGSKFHGVITGGNGRESDSLSKSYYFDVPRGKKAVSISTTLKRKQYPAEVIVGELVAPNGQTYSAAANVILTKAGLDVGRSLVNYVRAPKAGRWKFIITVYFAAPGDVINQPFTSTVRYHLATVRTLRPLPTAKTKLKRGKTVKWGVVIKNTTPRQQVYFADPRRNAMHTYRLASQVPGNNLQHLSLPNPEATPNWLVPTGVTALHFYANATVPIGLDTFWEYGDPETFGGPNGNSASVRVAAHPMVANGEWSGDLGEQGPFDGPAPTGKASVNLTARTHVFDLAADSSLGDYWIASLIPPPDSSASSDSALLPKRSSALAALAEQVRTTPVSASLAKPDKAKHRPKACGPGPVILRAGKSCTFVFSITPSAARGSVVRGKLGIQSLDLYGGTSNDLVQLPYAYKVVRKRASPSTASGAFQREWREISRH